MIHIFIKYICLERSRQVSSFELKLSIFSTSEIAAHPYYPHTPNTSKSNFFSVSPAGLMAVHLYRAVSSMRAQLMMSSSPESEMRMRGSSGSVSRSCPFLYHVTIGGGSTSSATGHRMVMELFTMTVGLSASLPNDPSVSSLGGTENKC